MEMLTHDQIWAAIDALAEAGGMSASGLARKAGLDSTTFNPSKRTTADGRERWPSTESIAKILKCTNTSVDDFILLLGKDRSTGASGGYSDTDYNYSGSISRPGFPLIGSVQAGHGGYFDDAGFPVGHGWDKVELPNTDGEGSYALRVSGDSMMPLYREGDVLIVDPYAKVRKGDRVVARSKNGEVFAKILVRQTSRVIEFQSANPDHENMMFLPADIMWVSRIVWASQ